MNINQHSKNKQLSDILRKQFGKNINLSRIHLISLFILSLCKIKTVCFSKLASCFDSNAKTVSCLRRIQRFIAKFDLSGDSIANLIFKILPLKGPYQLAIDRTNWKFGNLDINIFMLGIVHDGVSYPLLFKMLDKRGNSNTKERIDLLTRYINLFGKESIDCLLADREFVGEKWTVYLNENHIRYYIRIRENFLVFVPHNGHTVKASWLFNNLAVGQMKFYHKIYYVNNQGCYLSGSKIKGRDGKPELQIIISYNKPEKAIHTYKNRWQIETMFRALKGSGFDIEATHLTDIKRIEKLLLLVMIAFVWAYNVGDYVHRNLVAIKIKKHGNKEKSIFRYGLDLITEYLMRNRNEHKIPIFLFLITANPT